MAKKERKPDKRKKPLPDRRALEGMMHPLVAGLQGQANQDTPLGQAQALMYRAFEEPDEQRRLRLAKDALAICPDCADAYVLLAENTTSRKEALRLYEQAVTAGERALGPEAYRLRALRAASSRFRSAVYPHQGFFGSPATNRALAMKVSSRHGSGRWPVMGQWSSCIAYGLRGTPP